jgi:hypothetical protein
LIFTDFLTQDLQSDPLYYNQTIPSTIWPTRISQTIANIPSRQVCSAICTLISSTCQLFVYLENSESCYLGTFTTNVTVANPPANGNAVIYNRISEVGEYKPD